MVSYPYCDQRTTYGAPIRSTMIQNEGRNCKYGLVWSTVTGSPKPHLMVLVGLCDSSKGVTQVLDPLCGWWWMRSPIYFASPRNTDSRYLS